MKALIPILTLIVILSSCKSEATKQAEALKQKEDSIKAMINDNLNSRFTGYEIVEIRKDSSAYDSVFKFINQMYITIYHIAEISKQYEGAFIQFPSNMDAESKKIKIFILNGLKNLLTTVDSLNSKVLSADSVQYEPCYYVKYKVLNNKVKDEYEEYFFHSNEKVNHRPINFDKFLSSTNYKELKDIHEENIQYMSKFDWDAVPPKPVVYNK